MSHLSGPRYRCQQAKDRILSLRSNNTTGMSLAGQLRVAVGCSIAWMQSRGCCCVIAAVEATQ